MVEEVITDPRQDRISRCIESRQRIAEYKTKFEELSLKMPYSQGGITVPDFDGLLQAADNICAHLQTNQADPILEAWALEHSRFGLQVGDFYSAQLSAAKAAMGASGDACDTARHNLMGPLNYSVKMFENILNQVKLLRQWPQGKSTAELGMG